MSADERERKKKLDAIPIGPSPCDAGCGKPATVWFGSTGCATCGGSKCVAAMQRDRDAILRELDERY